MTRATQATQLHALQVLSRMQGLQSEIEGMQHEMGRRHFTGTSTAPVVSATVNGVGGLIDLHINPESAAHPELAQAVIFAVREATAAATAAYADMLGPISQELGQLRAALRS